MAEVHQIAYGWINPVIAYVLVFLGCLLGLVLSARARETTGVVRARWLSLAAVAIGGTGVWLMQFMAMLGFDVPGTLIRFDVSITIGSMLVAISGVAVGLFIVGMGRRRAIKLLLGGPIAGLALATMHYSAMAGLRLGGHVYYERRFVYISVGVAIYTATLALWFAQRVEGAAGTIGAAALIAGAACAMHYTAMAGVRVQLDPAVGSIPGASPWALLLPIVIVGCLVVTGLAYSTVGLSMDKESVQADAEMEQTRELTWPLLSLAALRVPAEGLWLSNTRYPPANAVLPTAPLPDLVRLGRSVVRTEKLW